MIHSLMPYFSYAELTFLCIKTKKRKFGEANEKKRKLLASLMAYIENSKTPDRVATRANTTK